MRGIENPIAVDGLRSISDHPDPEIRLTAIEYLLWVNQVDALSMATIVLSNTDAFDDRLLKNLLSGIANGIRSEAAIPGLERLLRIQEAETRRAAAAALSNITSPAIVRPLRLALDDSDFEVRLSAVRGLAKIHGQPNLLPSDDAFRRDELRFIAPLRSLSATRFED